MSKAAHELYAKTAVVIPTYNEKDNIVPLYIRVLEMMPKARVLIVDDNSPDGTGDLIRQTSSENPGIHLLQRERKKGLGAAYVAGFSYVLREWPEIEFIFQMDADFSHDPSYLPAMLSAAQDADVVVGSRYVDGISIVNWPLNRLIVSKLGTAYARLVTGVPVTDATSGYKCYRAEVLRTLDLGHIRSNGYVFQVETTFRAWRHGYRVKDFPIIFYERRRGESKLHLNIALEAFWVVLCLGMERVSHGAALAKRDA